MDKSDKESNNTELAAKIFHKYTDEVLNPKDTKKLLKTTIQKRLYPFQKDIKRLKEEGVSYNAILEMILKSTTEAGEPLVISTQAIRSYCQDILGIMPAKRPRKGK